MNITCDDTLECPGCVGDYTHLAGYRPYDNHETGRHSIELLFTCEMCGITFTVDFRQHKGQTQVTASRSNLRLGFNGDFERPATAAAAARQALTDARAGRPTLGQVARGRHHDDHTERTTR